MQSSAARIEARIAQAPNPIWKWSLIYNYLKDDPTDIQPTFSYTDYRTLLGFFLARQGKFDDFLFDDVTDDLVGPALLPNGTPNPQAPLQLIQDVNTDIWYSPVQRNMGGFYEDVTDLGPAGIKPYANGLVQSSPVNYSLLGPGLTINGASFYGLYLQWAATPVPPITAEFSFYQRVRFDADEQDFEQFMQFLWTIGGPDASQGAGYVKLITARSANL